MKNNPIAKGTKTIGINMPESLANEIEKRASSMHLSTSKCRKLILMDWLESGQKLTLKNE